MPIVMLSKWIISKSVIFKLGILWILVGVLTLMIGIREQRSGYIATPFVRPWIPKIPFMTSYYYIADPLYATNHSHTHEAMNSTLSTFISETRPFIREFKNPCYLRRDEDIIFGPALSHSESRLDRLDLTRIDYFDKSSGQVSTDTLQCLPYYFVLGKPVFVLFQ